MARLDPDIDITKYIAGGVVVFGLKSSILKFTLRIVSLFSKLLFSYCFIAQCTALDISTDRSVYRAHLYASPSVVDIDSDGEMDIFVPTALGYIYRINANGSVPFSGFRS
jgi:hypothetical protein